MKKRHEASHAAKTHDMDNDTYDRKWPKQSFEGGDQTKAL